MDISRILPGDFILSREKTVFSWLVRKVTGSEWSHVSVAMGNNKIIGATPFKGVSIKDLSALGEYGVYRLTYATETQRDGIVGFCRARLGYKYDFWQALQLGYRLLLDFSDIIIDSNRNKFICSELVAEACASQNIYFGYYADNVLPKHIALSNTTHRIG